MYPVDDISSLSMHRVNLLDDTTAGKARFIKKTFISAMAKYQGSPGGKWA
jgi:hypothetical protein